MYNLFGFKIQDSSRNFLNPASLQTYLLWIQDWRFWGKTSWILLPDFPCQGLRPGIQEVFLRILNPQGSGSKKFFSESWILNLVSKKLCKVLQSFGSQDSRFKIQDPGKNFLNPSPGPRLDSRSFSQNLESWILYPENFAKFCKVWGLKMQDAKLINAC